MDEIAVLIPCYNEEKTIGKVISDIQRVLPGAVIYVYDGTVKIVNRDSNLYYEKDIVKYLNTLKDSQYSIFISVKDEAAESLTSNIIEALKNLGLTTNLEGKWRNSYYAIISPEGVIEKFDATERLDTEGTFNNGQDRYSISSAGFECGNYSKIEINGQEYSPNYRGLNIVVYDSIEHRVVDTVAFDTHAGLDAQK